jgi:hypothetical protein
METAVLDACVLFRGGVQDFLLWVAEAGVFSPVWSTTIHEEWIKSRRAKFGDPLSRLEHARRQMEQAFPGANFDPDPTALNTVPYPTREMAVIISDDGLRLGCDGGGNHVDIIRVGYVLTQEAAAQLYAPFLSTISRVPCRMAPGRAADAALSKLEARVVGEGANLLVIETKSQGEFLFKERHGSLWLANPVQVYLDLLRSGGRAPEVAEHLRRERIGV